MMSKRATLLTILSLAASAFAAPILAEDLVRVDFQNESLYAEFGGVFGDDGEDMDKFYCDDAAAIPEPFDLVDARDDTAACGLEVPFDGVTSITWGNGRWKLQTGGVAPTYVRAVGLNFMDPVDETADCTRLGSLPFPIGGEAESDPFGVTCSCAGPCTALATFKVEGVFKKGVTRQDVKFPVRLENAAPAVKVDYVNPLYVCSDPLDANVRFLQTDGCDAGDPSVAEAEVFEIVQSAGGAEILLGRWLMPLKLRLRRVSSEGSGGGGGGGSCTLGQKGDPCSHNNDCCSASCRGKPGRQTCK